MCQMRYVDPTKDKDLSGILEMNKRWVAQETKKDPEYFDRLGKPQTPKYLYFGCSDSRVPANTILGLPPGEVFVHRNVGNQVSGWDLNAMSALEYAVQYLGVQHIIVTGHYDCGAIKASMQKQDLGLIENWLRSIRDVNRLHHKELAAIQDIDARTRRLVELNVVEQVLNVYKTGVVQRARAESHAKSGEAFPRVHALVFDPKDGLMQKLNVDFKGLVEKYRDIYDLQDLDPKEQKEH